MKRELTKERAKKLKKTEHVDLPANTYDIDDVIQKLKSTQYHRRSTTHEVFFVGVTEEQRKIARALGCERVYDRRPAY